MGRSWVGYKGGLLHSDGDGFCLLREQGMNLTADSWRRRVCALGVGGNHREEDRERAPGTKVASRERLAKQIWGDQGGTRIWSSLWVGAWSICFYC